MDTANTFKNLTAGFDAASGFDLSFDAGRIVFIARRTASDPFSVWEMNIDGADARRITQGPADCRQVIYLSTIYTIDAGEPLYQIAFLAEGVGWGSDSVYTCRPDGSGVRQITFSPQGVTDPYLLSDGRLLLSMLSAPHAPPDKGRDRGGSALLTVHTDGTDLFPFAGTHDTPAFRGMPCETADGWVVYIESPVDSRDRGGALVAVRRTRSLHTRRVIASDTEGRYHSPSPTPQGNLLVSYRPADGESYGLYLLDPRTGIRVARIFDDSARHELDAALVQPRSEPDGRSSVVDYKADFGQLYGLDAYLSDRSNAERIERGQIERLRVIQAEPGTATGGDEEARGKHGPTGLGFRGIKERVLGEVRVESDGSFFLDVPASKPLRLETLDRAGNVLQAMRSWLWVMPNERRGCIGCHEDRELTPPNRHVLALRKTPQRVGLPKRKAVPRKPYTPPSTGYPK